MSFCSYAEGMAMFDATPIENLFITEYLSDASGPALKVYLYARMLALHPELGGSLAEIARALRMDEDAVYQAFTYWEHRGLVRRVTDQPPTYTLQPVFSLAQTTENVLEKEMRANREFNNRLNELFDGGFIAPREINKAADWHNIYKFDQDAIVRMVKYEIERSPRKRKPSTVFDHVDTLVKKWSERGIHTLQDVERAILEETGEAEIAREVLKKLGQSRQPTEPELALARRWVEEWGYDRKTILEACDATTSAQNPSMNYLNGILKNRLDENQKYHGDVRTVLKELNPKQTDPTPDQLTRYARLIEQGFAPELIVRAAVYCHRKNQVLFDDLMWRLEVFREDGVCTAEEADLYMKQMSTLSRELRRVFRQAGSEKRPSYGNLKTYRGWKDAYSAELIAYAAECAQNKEDPISYMGKVLSQWQKDGVTTAEQARARHGAWQQTARPTAEKPANPALNYAQREYRDEDFGDDFYVNLDEYGEDEPS